MKLHQHSTHNNPVLKIVAATLFIIFPLIGFILGMHYQNLIEIGNNFQLNTSLLSSPTQIQTKNKTLGWKTYNNEKYGLEFQYPQTWKIEIDRQSFKESKDIFHISIWGSTQKKDTELYDGAAFSIGEPIVNNKDIQKWITNYYGEKSEITGIKYEYSRIKVANNIFETMYACGQGCFRYYFIQNNGLIYRLMTTSGGDKKDQYEQTINTIISTLKFNDRASALPTSLLKQPTSVATITQNDTTPPKAYILSPEDFTHVRSGVKVVANVTDNVKVDRVEFYAGSSDYQLIGIVRQVPFEVIWTPSVGFNGYGNRSNIPIYIKAYDSSGNYGGSSISVYLDQ